MGIHGALVGWKDSGRQGSDQECRGLHSNQWAVLNRHWIECNRFAQDDCSRHFPFLWWWATMSDEFEEWIEWRVGGHSMRFDCRKLRAKRWSSMSKCCANAVPALCQCCASAYQATLYLESILCSSVIISAAIHHTNAGNIWREDSLNIIVIDDNNRFEYFR